VKSSLTSSYVSETYLDGCYVLDWSTTVGFFLFDAGWHATRYQESRTTDTCNHQGIPGECTLTERLRFDGRCKPLRYWDLLWEGTETRHHMWSWSILATLSPLGDLHQALPYRYVKRTPPGLSTVEPLHETLENPGNQHPRAHGENAGLMRSTWGWCWHLMSV
jgi:hypothetical protein